MKVSKIDAADVEAAENVVKEKRPHIPAHTKFELWSKAGGRCQFRGCNKELWEDGLTCSKLNLSNIAHIVSWTPTGPRGDKVRSPLLATAISNLMLTCQKHNKVIDSYEYVKDYPESLLLKMKEEHEDRIKIATSIVPENKTTPLVYMSKIFDSKMNISDIEIKNAAFPNFYPKIDEKIYFNLEVSDTDSDFWNTEQKNLDIYFTRKLKPKLEDGTINHLSIFGFAPQPLLIYLGYLLGDKYSIDIYPLQRNPKEWKWRETGPEKVNYKITYPSDLKYQPVLTISLSDKIAEERVSASIDGNYSRWDVSIEKPDREFLTNKEYLYEFSRVVSALLDEIKNAHGISTELRVIPVMPIATSIEFGRRIDPKYSMPIKIYNHNEKSQIFEPVLDICLPKNRGDLN